MNSSVTAQNTQKLKHPKGLYLCGLTIMWERFAYYGMKSVLILYLAAEIAKGGFGLSKGSATVLMGWFGGLVYLMPVLGGYVSDRYLGTKKSIILGCILICLGQVLLFLGISRVLIYCALGLITLGNGFFKPNLNTMVGDLYSKEDVRKDSAFSILYMFVNLGATVSPFICGALAEQIFIKKSGTEIISYGFKYAFLASAISMLIGLIFFIAGSKKYLGTLGEKPNYVAKSSNNKNASVPLTLQEKRRVIVILILAFFVIFFWIGFEQGATSLSLFTQESVNRNLFGKEISTAAFQSINAIFCVAFAPVLGALWVKLASSKNGDLSIPTKMGVGLILLGIGCFFVVLAVLQKNSSGMASMIWIVSFYFFETIGELCLSPVGLSMVSKLAPAKLISMITGVWFISTFAASTLSGYVAKAATDLGELEVFAILGVVVIILGLILILIRKRLAAMME